jgi:hypothetical protein
MMQEFIEGTCLASDKLHELLPEHVQDIVCAKISEQIQYLRSLPSEGYYGRPYQQGWMEPRKGMNLSSTRQMVHGPYKTYEEFLSAIYCAEEIKCAWNLRGDDWPSDHESKMAEFWSMFAELEPHEPKFTWIDSKFSNIIVRPIKTDDADGSEDWDVFLIDWEDSGWYPAWVQSWQLYHRLSAYTIITTKLPGSDKEDKKGLPYREDEIRQLALKDFDPHPSWAKLKEKLRARDWSFF